MADNLANDFVDAIQQTQEGSVERGIPALHPKERNDWVNLAEEEPLPGIIDHNLLQLPKNNFKARLRRFCVGIPSDVEEYEEIQNKCLSGEGWILVREEWVTDKDGEQFITIKYLEPQEKKETKRRR